jgi:hypothetical protein
MPHYNHFVAFCSVRVAVIHRIKFLRYYLKAHYSVIYNELHEIKRGRYGPRRSIPPDARTNGDGEKPMLQLALTGLRV